MKTQSVMNMGRGLILKALVVAMLLGGTAWAQEKKPALASERPSRPAGAKQVAQWQQSVDAGDAYPTPRGTRKLRRSLNRVVVAGDTTRKQAERVASVKGASADWSDAEASAWGPDHLMLIQPVDSEFSQAKSAGVRSAVSRPAPDTMSLRARTGVQVDPVFVDPDTGLLMVMEPEMLICLQVGVDSTAYFGADASRVVPLPGTQNQFVLSMGSLTAEEILAECSRLSEDVRVAWAEPNFRSEGVRHVTPNDTLFGDQWHLQDGLPGSVDAETAWDTSQGAGITIAIVDDGVESTHPDLQANIAPGQTNVVAGTTNAAPFAAEDSHGTAVAGVAAAVAQNSLGVAGVAYQSKILPIKMATGETNFASDVQLATAFRYAAGLAGGAGWAGADVINFSWSWSESTAVNSALTDAAANGRGGLGCPVFVSAGNDGSGWYSFAVPASAGSHTLRFEYVKDISDSAGEDCIWLDDVFIPGIGTESFEGGTFPPTGWTTGGSASWTQVADDRHAIGTGAKSARSGAITDLQTTWLQTIRTTGAGDITFWLWTSTEEGYDAFRFYLDGVMHDPYGSGGVYTDPGGVYGTTTNISYPASHADTIAMGASTDCDYRSDYSQFGPGLDFVTASSGGTNGISTTDRTGADGYVAGNYDNAFGGTSSSSPLAAGIGALVLAKNTNLTAVEVRTLLRKSCAKIGGVTYAGGDAGAGGWNQYYGYGKLMATLALSNTPSPTAPIFSGIVAGGASVTLPFLSPAGVQCILQYTTNLAGAPMVWVQADSESGTGGEVTLEDSSPTDPARMYRVISGP